MEINYKFIDDVMIINLYGELHSEQTEVMELRLKENLPKADKFVLNCIDLEYIDSKGLGSLIKIYTSIRDQQGELVICCVNGKVEKVFNLTHFHNYIKLFPSQEEALAYFKGQ